MANIPQNDANSSPAFLKKYSARIFNLLIIATIAIGTGASYWVARQSNRELHQARLLHAQIIADTLNQRDIKDLTFTSGDRANPAFIRMSAEMKRAAQSAGCRILYSMTQRGGGIVFGPENLPEDDPFASPPGTLYKSPPHNLKSIFHSGKAVTSGPYTDEYGTFVSAFAPVISPDTGKVILVVGMDIEATDWKWHVISDAAPAITMTILLVLLLMTLIRMQKTHMILVSREHLLKEKEERYRTIFENTGSSSILIHDDRTIMLANRKFEKLSGYSRQELEGKMDWITFIDKDDLERMRQYSELRRTDPGSVPDSYEFRFVNRSGEKREIFLTIAAIPDTKENIASLMDITEHRQAQEKIAKVFMMAPGGMSISRITDGLFVDVNIGFTEISGWGRNEVIGRTSLDIHFWPDPAERTRLVEELQAGKEIMQRSFQFRHKDGSVRTGIYSARSIEMEDGIFILFVMQDTTDQRRLEEDHRRLQQQVFQSRKMDAIGQLAGGVAHDFNNMLSVILGNTEMAMEETDPSSSLHKALQEVLLAAKRSADLTRQLLTFARKQTAIPRMLDLNETVTGMLKMLRRLIGEDIDLDWLPGQDLWKVRIDPSQVDQLLANLIVNARDAITQKGRISIETSNAICNEDYCLAHPDCIPGKYVVLTVQDNGCGMDEELQAKIFDPFFTTKKEGLGTGLGLATVYGIVGQNRGHIDVESKPGKGATFRIHLPKCKAEDLEAVEDIVIGKIEKGTETILIVEDEEAVLNLAKGMLERLGYHVLAAQKADEAIGIAKSYKGDIDLLLTDVVMPDINGKELSERILSIIPGIRCLYMSGYTADVIARQGILEAGIHLIQKPFALKDLAAKVRETL